MSLPLQNHPQADKNTFSTAPKTNPEAAMQAHRRSPSNLSWYSAGNETMTPISNPLGRFLRGKPEVHSQNPGSPLITTAHQQGRAVIFFRPRPEAKRAAVLVPGTQTPADCVTDLKALPLHIADPQGRRLGRGRGRAVGERMCSVAVKARP